MSEDFLSMLKRRFMLANGDDPDEWTDDLYLLDEILHDNANAIIRLVEAAQKVAGGDTRALLDEPLAALEEK